MATTETTPTIKLVPFGQGYAVLLDPDLLRQIGVDENTPVDVTTDGRSIVITAAVGRPSEAELNETLDRVNAKWGVVLKKLAE
ncbi:MAG: hypothetical protein ABIP55_07865 [Tepidisphaeraceae bacterium]